MPILRHYGFIVTKVVDGIRHLTRWLEKFRNTMISFCVVVLTYRNVKNIFIVDCASDDCRGIVKSDTWGLSVANFVLLYVCVVLCYCRRPRPRLVDDDPAGDGTKNGTTHLLFSRRWTSKNITIIGGKMMMTMIPTVTAAATTSTVTRLPASEGTLHRKTKELLESCAVPPLSLMERILLRTTRRTSKKKSFEKTYEHLRGFWFWPGCDQSPRSRRRRWFDILW